MCVTKVLTESGSTYEVDHANRMARRLLGNGPATERSAEWRAFKSVFLFHGHLLIEWTQATPLLPGSPTSAIPATVTSRVTETHGPRLERFP
jgi:hypothetical protein